MKLKPQDNGDFNRVHYQRFDMPQFARVPGSQAYSDFGYELAIMALNGEGRYLLHDRIDYFCPWYIKVAEQVIRWFRSR